MSDLDAPVGHVKLKQTEIDRTTGLYAKEAMIEGMPA
jgi:hypothetical protein